MKLQTWRRIFRKKLLKQNFMKIRSVGAELFHAEIQTGEMTCMTKRSVAFRNFCEGVYVMKENWTNHFTQAKLWRSISSRTVIIPRPNFCQKCKNFSKKSRTHLKILDAKLVTWSKIHTQDTKILVATVQDLVAWAT